MFNNALWAERSLKWTHAAKYLSLPEFKDTFQLSTSCSSLLKAHALSEGAYLPRWQHGQKKKKNH